MAHPRNGRLKSSARSTAVLLASCHSTVAIYSRCMRTQIKTILDDIVSTLPDPFSMQEIQAKVPLEERTPYVIVAFQECERMNGLTSEMRRTLKELNLGLKV